MEYQENFQSIETGNRPEIRITERMLRLAEVKSRTGLSRSSIYAYIKNAAFPKPVHLGARSVGWPESEINEWITDKIQTRQ